MLQSQLTSRSRRALSASDRKVLDENVAEAQKICVSLDGLGGQRADILAMVLNGLANAKVAQADGGAPRPGVLEHLFQMIHETESLEIPHSNAKVRLNHCLGACDRILAKQIKLSDLNELEEHVVKLEQLRLLRGELGEVADPTPKFNVETAEDKPDDSAQLGLEQRGPTSPGAAATPAEKSPAAPPLAEGTDLGPAARAEREPAVATAVSGEDAANSGEPSRDGTGLAKDGGKRASQDSDSGTSKTPAGAPVKTEPTEID